MLITNSSEPGKISPYIQSFLQTYSELSPCKRRLNNKLNCIWNFVSEHCVVRNLCKLMNCKIMLLTLNKIYNSFVDP